MNSECAMYCAVCDNPNTCSLCYNNLVRDPATLQCKCEIGYKISSDPQTQQPVCQQCHQSCMRCSDIYQNSCMECYNCYAMTDDHRCIFNGYSNSSCKNDIPSENVQELKVSYSSRNLDVLRKVITLEFNSNLHSQVI